MRKMRMAIAAAQLLLWLRPWLWLRQLLRSCDLNWVVFVSRAFPIGLISK